MTGSTAIPASWPSSADPEGASSGATSYGALLRRTLAVAGPWLALFDPEGESPRERRVRASAAARPRREERLYCAACRHPITRQDERISVEGAAEHVCTNPYGLTFRIACFREAEGCRATGVATAEHTWFAGYRWRIALCAACGAHLGWLYASPANRFHGLIVDRLTSRGPAA